MASKTAVDLSTHPLTNWTGPLGLPDFVTLKDNDFGRVFDAALADHNREISEIAQNPEPATIDNTLVALELAGDALNRVSAVFWGRAGAHTNETIQALEREIAPKMSKHFSAIYMNDQLFARIDDLYQRRNDLGLDAETLEVLDKAHRGFVRAGAKLGKKDKERLSAIGQELAGLGAQFGQNVLADEKDWVMILNPADVAGLPDFLLNAMSAAAKAHGEDGKFAVTLSRSIYEPFTSLSPRRDLREKAFRAFSMRGQNGGDTDNTETVRRTLELRAEKAKLLGYDSFAAYKLDNTMAKTPAAVMNLLDPVWDKAREKLLPTSAT